MKLQFKTGKEKLNKTANVPVSRQLLGGGGWMTVDFKKPGLFTTVYYPSICLCKGFHIFARLDKLTGFVPGDIIILIKSFEDIVKFNEHQKPQT